jgi:hypothetical protein
MLSTEEVFRIRKMRDPLALQDALIGMTEQRNALAAVVGECWEVAKDGGDLDGFTILEIMLRAKLIDENEATEDDCVELDVEPGEIVYRLTGLGLAALDRPNQSVEDAA